jgi:penicillin-binding protein 1C
MSDPLVNPGEDSRARFRRLLTEAEEAEGSSKPTQPLASEDKSDSTAGETPAEEIIQNQEQITLPLSQPVVDDNAAALSGAEEIPTLPLFPGEVSPDEIEGSPGIDVDPGVVAESRPTMPLPTATQEKTRQKDGDTKPTAAARAVRLDKGAGQTVTVRSGTPALSGTYPPTPPAGLKPQPGPSIKSSTQTQPYRRETVARRQSPKTLPGTPRQAAKSTTQRKIDWRTGFGCLLRMMIMGIFGLVVLGILVVSLGVYQYYRILATLPDVNTLRDKAAQFETTRIYDRNGNVLYEVLDPTAGRRTYVTIDNISPYMLAATIATEDKEFYSHPGFDPWAIVRALLQNYTSGEIVSGASTITQQLARNLLFTPEERFQQSYQRKIREALLAIELTRVYTKSEILELYLNENNYANHAYGVQAAAETYFGTTADQLTLFQAAFLAGIPQTPLVYDVYENREVTMARTEQVLSLLVQASAEQGCIFVSNNTQPLCIDAVQAVEAANQIRSHEFKNPDIPMRYPHWVNYIYDQVKSMFDAQTIYRSGFSIYTTLDPGLQDQAEEIVRDQIAQLESNNASNGAMVIIRPSTGEILTMVGSADFYNEDIDGQVNMATSPRQPGSSIKPLTYLAAFEQGWTPATLIWDVPSEFPPSGKPDDQRPPYKPVNYDQRFHGPVTVRTALANSFNVPAVKTLDFVGIYDDPLQPGDQGLVAMAQRLGITTLTRNDYGLALTLGGGDVSLLELTGAYATLANSGRRVPAYSITRIVDHIGNVVFEHEQPIGEQVLRAEHAFLISSILSDNEARSPMFGRNSVLNLPFPAAAKTGTTDDFRDNWTMGYTPDVAIGVWVGNADYTPMQNTTGLTGAAPIWAEMMQASVQQLTGGSSSNFVRPVGVVDRVICVDSGTEPSQWCPEQTNEMFAADQPPLSADEDLWMEVLIDTWTGLRASSACPDFTDEAFVLNVVDPWAVRWLTEDSQGRAWAEEKGFESPIQFVPNRECKETDPRPILEISAPRNGDRITNSPVDIYARVGATENYRRYWLEYGLGENPVKWELIDRSGQQYAQTTKLFTWDVSQIPAGVIALRLMVESGTNTFAETKILLNMQVPTPTPTPTATFTPTSTATPTSTPTLTPTPTNTPTITPTPSPSHTPTPSPTETEAPPQPSQTP